MGYQNPVNLAKNKFNNDSTGYIPAHLISDSSPELSMRDIDE